MKGNLKDVATRWSSAIPAVLLALLVGSVFFFLQGIGPESVLRRFHVAAVNSDFRAMRLASVDTATPDAIAVLRNEISAIARTGARYDVYRIEKKGATAIAAANYSMPGASRTFLYVLERKRGRWYVNPDATIGLMLQKFGPPTAAH